MKYFPYSLIAAVNGWHEGSDGPSLEARVAFDEAVVAYHRELDTLRPRVSGPAFEFFRRGYSETGLHDARLLAFSIGDGLSYAPDGLSPFRVNRQAASATLEILNYEQSYHYTFRAEGVRRSGLSFEADDFYPTPRFGDVYTYELTSADEKHLSLAFLFADGAEIAIECQRLVYRRRRIRRTYDAGEMYR